MQKPNASPIRAANPKTKEAVAEAVAGKPSSRKIDGYLKISGAVLAASCAMLPFVMYYDTLKLRLQISSITESHVVDPLDRSNQKVFLTGRNKTLPEQAKAMADIDPMQTATTVSNETPEQVAKREKAATQPFPDLTVYLLRDVVGRLAMIEDDTGYWFVEKGSYLPDGTTVQKIARNTANGVWEITTSTGDVVSLSN